MYYVVLAIFLAGFLLIYRIIHSPFGQVLKAIRENEPRAISLGYDADRYKLLAFVLSAALAGLAGATKAIVFQLASLTDVHWTMSGEVVLMTLLGGMGTIFGPVVGAFVIIGAGELPRRLRPVGDGDHRRDLRRLRARVPPRHRRRARRMVGEAARLSGATRAVAMRGCVRRRCSPRSLGGCGDAAARPRPTSSTGTCRDGAAARRLRAARCPTAGCASLGAFAKGRRTGTFLFWSATGARIAVIPYDDDAQGRHRRALVRAGDAAGASRAASSKPPTSAGVLHGVTRSWHRERQRRGRSIATSAASWRALRAAGAPSGKRAAPTPSARALARARRRSTDDADRTRSLLEPIVARRNLPALRAEPGGIGTRATRRRTARRTVECGALTRSTASR